MGQTTKQHLKDGYFVTKMDFLESLGQEFVCFNHGRENWSFSKIEFWVSLETYWYAWSSEKMKIIINPLKSGLKGYIPINWKRLEIVLELQSTQEISFWKARNPLVPLFKCFFVYLGAIRITPWEIPAALESIFWSNSCGYKKCEIQGNLFWSNQNS